MNVSHSGSSTRKDLYFILAIGLLLFVFYPDLFLAKSASLKGDHIEQHYPWACLLAQSLKQFQLPWWTDLIHSGFPIAAEGQIGVFYLPNLVLYFFLPISWAYAYVNVFHFLISGCGTYLYARFMKLNPLSAFVASGIFLYGAGYGGAYYNITSLKTLAWFPFFLLFFERFLVFKKWRDLIFLSFAVSLSLLAGYLQVAILGLLIFVFYVLFRLATKKDIQSHRLVFMFRYGFPIFIAVSLGLILAFPQLFLTFQLATFSNRLNLSEDYAYIGSMSPLSMLSILLSEFQGIFRGNSVYGGVISVFFIAVAFFSKEARKTDFVKTWCFMGFIALFLAVGRWSPLYVALVKLTQFYAFRMPSKFVVFICFALAMLAGAGVDFIDRSVHLKMKTAQYIKAIYCYVVSLFFVILAHGAAFVLVAYNKHIAFSIGKWIVRQYIHGKTGHPHALDDYYSKLASGLTAMADILSLNNPWNAWNYCLFGVSLIFMLWVWRSKRIGRLWLFSALTFLLIDLYAFSWRDIRRDFDSYEAINKPSLAAKYLSEEKRLGRVERIYGFRSQREQLPMIPSVNMLYDLPEIGVYSPFVLKTYYETIGNFGNINDSNHAFNPSPEFVTERLPLLNFLGVSHILSTQPLNHPRLKKVLTPETPEAGCFLYLNESKRAKAHFVTEFQVVDTWKELKARLLEIGFEPQKMLLIEKSEHEKIASVASESQSVLIEKSAAIQVIAQAPMYEEYQLQIDRPGFFVVSNIHYPGWKATLDGHSVPVLKAYGLFQAVWVDAPGLHRVVFTYSAFSR